MHGSKHTPDLHIRRSARRQARKAMAYWPSTKKNNVDEENQISHIQTESDAPSPLETRRHAQNAEDLENFPHQQKSSTWDGNDIAHSPKSSQPGPPSTEKTDFEPNSRDAPTGFTESSVESRNGGGKARKRKFFDPSRFKKNHDNGDASGSSSDDDSWKRKGPKPTAMSMFRTVMFSWLNILLIAVPVGIALHFALDQNNKTDQIIVFVVNFIAIIPLAGILSYSTEQIALYVGEVMGGLLNASFGNAVELIVSIIALQQGQIIIVQTSLLGSMLSNLLLVLGMCFFFGGINRSEQYFNTTVAGTAASLLALAIGSLIIPTAFAIFTPGDADDGVTPTSRGTAVLLLVVYGCYLLFQLKTHRGIYNAPSKKVPKRSHKKEAGAISSAVAHMGGGPATAVGRGSISEDQLVQDSASGEEDEEEVPELTAIGAIVTLCISTAFVGWCAEYMVSAIDAVSENVSKEFIGLILLPIVGNAAEHATAVTVAIKDKMDLSIGVATGSSLQIALLVLPLAVMLNWWGLGAPADLNLSFDGFQVAVLFISIILVNYVVADGKSNWLEGALLQVTYLIIAVAAWFYPAPSGTA